MDVKGRPVVTEGDQDRSEDASSWELLNQGQEVTERSLGLVGWEQQGSSWSWDGKETDSSAGGS